MRPELEQGQNVDRTRSGVASISGKPSKLMVACSQNDEARVRLVMQDENTNVAELDESGKVALHYCAESGSVALIEEVFNANPSLLDTRDQDGMTPLNYAIIGDNRPVSQFLMGKGANVNNVDAEKRSLVHWASVCEHKELLESLLTAGALVSIPDLSGAHALHYITQMCTDTPDRSNEKSFDILRTLLRHGANVNARDLDERTPLLWAASSGCLEALQLLIQSGADKQAVDRDHLSALHCAASHGQATIIAHLLDISPNASADCGDRLGSTPLFYAITLGHVACAKLLLDRGADPNWQDKKSRSSAHCGAAKGQLRGLKLLHSYGGSMELENHRGDLPLHEAVQACHKDVVLWLLGLNASNVSAENHFGRTPLHIAAGTGNVDMIEILLKRGAEANSLFRYQKILLTPLDIATARAPTALILMLEAHGGQLARNLPPEVITRAQEDLVRRESLYQNNKEALKKAGLTSESGIDEAHYFGSQAISQKQGHDSKSRSRSPVAETGEATFKHSKSQHRKRQNRLDDELSERSSIPSSSPTSPGKVRSHRRSKSKDRSKEDDRHLRQDPTDADKDVADSTNRSQSQESDKTGTTTTHATSSSPDEGSARKKPGRKGRDKINSKKPRPSRRRASGATGTGTDTELNNKNAVARNRNNKNQHMNKRRNSGSTATGYTNNDLQSNGLENSQLVGSSKQNSADLVDGVTNGDSNINGVLNNENNSINISPRDDDEYIAEETDRTGTVGHVYESVIRRKQLQMDSGRRSKSSVNTNGQDSGTGRSTIRSKRRGLIDGAKSQGKTNKYNAKETDRTGALGHVYESRIRRKQLKMDSRRRSKSSVNTTGQDSERDNQRYAPSVAD